MVEKKKKSLTKAQITQICVLAILFIGVILMIVFSNSIFGVNSIFNLSPFQNDALNTLYQKIPALLRSIEIAVFSIIIFLLIKAIMLNMFKKSNRGLTVSRLLVSFIKYLIAIIAIVLILSSWGIDTAALLGAVGILGLVVGLGAQSLITDVIAGIFIVFEGEYQVGDIVVIDGWRGTVEEIGIRSTRIVDAGGNIKIINNSQIVSVVNQTKELSLATITIGIDYSEKIQKVELIIKDNLPTIAKNIPAIVEGPFYKGVSSLGDSSINLLFIARCKEEDVYQVQRDLNREILILCNNYNINIPFPQIVVNKATENYSSVTAKQDEEARKFSKDQGTISKSFENKGDDDN